MNLFAYDGNSPVAIFALHAKTKEDARRKVLNHGYLIRVHHVVFKHKKYGLSDVYAGRMDTAHEIK